MWRPRTKRLYGSFTDDQHADILRLANSVGYRSASDWLHDVMLKELEKAKRHVDLEGGRTAVS